MHERDDRGRPEAKQQRPKEEEVHVLLREVQQALEALLARARCRDDAAAAEAAVAIAEKERGDGKPMVTWKARAIGCA